MQIPRAFAREIAEVAERTGRSVAFVARRALAAAPDAPVPAMTDLAALAITTDEDDPANTHARLKAAAKSRTLDEALAAAWAASRSRFLAWAEREAEAATAERADDLDEGLRAASAAETPPARLAELARSDYPKIRALVAVHPHTPAEVLGLLAGDKERYVREAVENRARR